MDYNGLPKQRNSVSTNLHQYLPMRNMIGIRDGITMVGDKIVIPTKARRMMLDRLNLAHQGVQRMKPQARKEMYWQGMTYTQ